MDDDCGFLCATLVEITTYCPNRFRIYSINLVAPRYASEYLVNPPNAQAKSRAVQLRNRLIHAEGDALEYALDVTRVQQIHFRAIPASSIAHIVQQVTFNQNRGI